MVEQVKQSRRRPQVFSHLSIRKYHIAQICVHVRASVRHVSVCEFASVCVSIERLLNNKTRLALDHNLSPTRVVELDLDGSLFQCNPFWPVSKER